MIKKLVYYFSTVKCDGDIGMKHLLGGKGANLAEMCRLGIPVPPGFTLSTALCTEYYKYNQLPAEAYNEIQQAIKFLETTMSKGFGDKNNPLLFSVRSGSVNSMPGMLDTILNVGLNDLTVKGLAQKSGDRFAYDSYRRFIQMYSTVVLNLESYLFEEVLERTKQDYLVVNDSELTANALKEIVSNFKDIVLTHTNKAFPQDVNEQLYTSINAVFASWMNPRAITYREINNIPENLGTAVNIQVMVFGNLNDNSATGVAFTRNPSTGVKKFFGEYLINAQGEDVVAGIRTPLSINSDDINDSSTLQKCMPEIYEELTKIYLKLEHHYRDMQDIEFTVQDRKLWILQTRSGKRTIQAAVKIAVDMVKEGLITKEEAICRIDPKSFCQLLHPILDDSVAYNVISCGLPASPGSASGNVVFNSLEAEYLSKNGQDVILVRNETNPEDIKGMSAATGVLTARGGMTSHAAVVARGMGKPCICSANGLIIDSKEEFFTISGGVKVKKGDKITINGTNGEVILGVVKTILPQLSNDFAELMQWIDESAIMKVRANADTTEDVTTALKFDIDGIGLCRTEHMFFAEERISIVQEMITANDIEERQNALYKLEQIQTLDFVNIFTIMGEKRVTIRLLDPPLHEFLPHDDHAMEKIASNSGRSIEDIKKKVSQLSEKNPMLGHRGCRLAISYPEIYEMQIRAIFAAAQDVGKRKNTNIIPEIMIPLIMDEKELSIVAQMIHNIAKSFNIRYYIGTMIELPRAALIADRIAKFVDFFSFGTNDLTQTTMGLSRDDSASFLGVYKNKGIFRDDPFEVLDKHGVGKLIEIAVTLGRKSNPNLKLGLCGEHGGDPESIRFCFEQGLDYVSCSPYRVPIAKLVSAQCSINSKNVQNNIDLMA